MGRILLISDLHLANRVNFGKAPTNPTFMGCNSRFHAIAEAFNYYIDLAVKEGCQAVIVPGDIYHDRMILQVPVLNAVYSLFEEANKRVPVYAMTGNHDLVSAKALYGEEGLHSLFTFKEVCTVVDTPRLVELDDFSLSFLPFNISKDKTISDATNLYNKVKGKTKLSLSFFHHSFEGATTGPTNWKMPSEIKPSDVPDFNLNFSGHLHKHQKVGKITYVGSLLQHDLGERDYLGGAIIANSDGTWRHLPNDFSPKFKVIEASTEKELKAYNDKDYKVIKWVGDESDGIALRDNIDNAIVEIKPKLVTTQARTNINNFDTVEDMMKKFVKTKLGIVDKNVLAEGLRLYKDENT